MQQIVKTQPVVPAELASHVQLYWLPLGAGGRLVRWNGRAFERWSAWRGHRRPQELYHSALEVKDGPNTFVVEMTPAWGSGLEYRGVVSVGPVGSRLLGGLRLFRYEVRRWQDGVIGDIASAVGPPRCVSTDPAQSRLLLDLVPEVPTATWGRDECGAGDMWNSNAVVAWLLARSGHDMSGITPPAGGRAPGWCAGLAVAQRHASSAATASHTGTPTRGRVSTGAPAPAAGRQ
jgi:hypothetical protein